MVTWLASLGSLPGSLPALSTDAMILAVTVLVFAYGALAGYVALIRESISVYVGLVLANSFGAALYQMAAKGAGANFPVTQSDIQLALLVAPIVLLQLVRRHHSHHMTHRHSIILVLLLSALSAMLVVSSVLSQLSPDALSSTLMNSNLASWIYNLRLVWLAGVPIAVVLGAVFHPKRRTH